MQLTGKTLHAAIPEGSLSYTRSANQQMPNIAACLFFRFFSFILLNCYLLEFFQLGKDFFFHH